MTKQLKNSIKYIIVVALMYIPLFGYLDTLPLRIWDESRLAVNSYEMLNNGNFIVTGFEGKPDMWNTKPPFLIWIQVLFIKIRGLLSWRFVYLLLLPLFLTVSFYCFFYTSISKIFGSELLPF